MVDSFDGQIKERTLGAKSLEEGLQVYPVTYDPSQEWQCVGVVYEIQPPEVGQEFKQNIFDFELTEELFPRGYGSLVGGSYYIRDANAIDDRDILEFSVVDKNDVLGLFSQYGLTVGQDVLELAKFIRTHSVIGGTLVEFVPGQRKVLPVGLFLRVSYTRYGSTSLILKVNFYLPR